LESLVGFLLGLPLPSFISLWGFGGMRTMRSMIRVAISGIDCSGDFFAMSNPWDRQPLPSAGNADPNDIYNGVGRVLSQWEIVELQLGYLYSAFVLKHQDWEALLEYGRGSSSKDRFSVLSKAAKQFFIVHSDQTIEGELECLLRRTNSFKDRRHDVAHAIVRDETWAQWVVQDPRSETRTPKGYFLLPTHYKRNRYDEIMLPTYAYNSVNLAELEYQLAQLSTEIMGFGYAVARHSTS
jgi:hypothetical protein